MRTLLLRSVFSPRRRASVLAAESIFRRRNDRVSRALVSRVVVRTVVFVFVATVEAGRALALPSRDASGPGGSGVVDASVCPLSLSLRAARAFLLRSEPPGSRRRASVLAAGSSTTVERSRVAAGRRFPLPSSWDFLVFHPSDIYARSRFLPKAGLRRLASVFAALRV